MASSSNSSMALVPLPRRNCYDVFITFRGEDTRNNFTDFLFDALEKKGIYAFRDDTNLRKGEFIGPELLQAIERSQVFVAVFSRNYAFSTWCLQELEKICECVQVYGKHVLPVFYDVDPSQVRKQSGIYHKAFVKHEKRFQQDPQKVSRWREALKQVGNISGWDLRRKQQSVERENIVQTILNILKCNTSFISKDLVGINSRIEALENHLLLDSVDSVRVIGIWGMGGIGKTTLAMNLYGQISHRFEASCFFDDVSKICRLDDGPLNAQKQILFQTLGIDHHQVHNRYIATDLMQRRLCHKRALVILDNVDRVEQLEEIAVHRNWLGEGSRIIIVSRNQHILKEVDVVYKVPLLDWTESHKLFCQKAFKLEKIIMKNYQSLAYEILNYDNGLPLAIKVLGSFLFGCNMTEWESALARLRESPNKDVMDVLQLSYDGLQETEKEIFLDIACFFNSRNEKYIKNILNCCGFHADIGLRVLIDKSLITIHGSIIEMHSLLEELGRKIVQDNSSKEQRKWSRMWSKKQLYNVMENTEKHVEAVVFFGGIDKNVEFLSKMSNLRLLIIRHDEYYMINNYELVMSKSYSLSNKLRYVQWTGYPFKYLPSSFHPTELVELILVRSGIKQLWKNKKSQHLPNLKRLDLSDSKKLEKIVDFGEFPNLEWLNLERCINLVKLDPSIGLLRKLVYLNLDCCYNLVSIPNIFGLSSLEYLSMSGCSKLMKPGISSEKKKHDIRESTSHCGSTPSVFKLFIFPNNASFSAPVTHTYMLPCFRILYCLCKVDISFCHLSHVPDAIECLHWLERLNLGGNNFVTLPSLRNLSKLVYLNLEHCKLLESLPQLPFPTTIRHDHRENKHWWWEQNENKDDVITGLVIFNCPKLGESECCSSITFSWMTQFIQANQQSYGPYLYELQIVTPGSEIPSWINNKSEGGLILIDESRIKLDNKNNIIGFVFCAVFCMAPQDQTMIECLPLSIYMKMGDERNCRKFPAIIDRDLIPTKSSHLWLVYFPREYYDVFGTIRVYCTRYGRQVVGMDVKCCGYRWVCKQELQEFNLTKKVLTAASATETDSDAVGLQLLLQNQILHQVHQLHKKQKADVNEENNQVPSPESPATEEVQEQTPVSAQVEDEAVAIASETNSNLSASDEGSSKATISPTLVKQLRDETGAGMMDCQNALSESEGDIIKAQELLRKKGLASADKKATRETAEGRIGSYIHDSRIGVLVEVNCETDFVSRGEIFKELVDDIAMQVAACPQVEYVVTEDVPEEFVKKETKIEMQKEDLASKPEQIRSRIVEGRIRKRLEDLALLEQPYIKNDKVTVKDMVKQTIATIGENMKVTRFVRFNLGEGLEKKSEDFAAEVAAQTTAKPVTTPVKEEPAAAEAKETEPKKSAVVVSAALVKQLREETGAGMMDCKKALAETEGDLEKAQAYLRKKGLSSADKKSGRLAAEGRIGTYIHDARIGVLIEVNCETDFVGRSEKFKELVDDLAMQVAACPQVQFVSIEDIPETIVTKEKELEMQREDLASKPENIREKIVEGRISKRLGELALLEQPFIKDDSVIVKDLVRQSIAAIGENIKVRRFVRFTLGETVQKETAVPA